MPNSAWDNGTTYEKLKMLRDDIQMISDAHNRLMQDFLTALRRIETLEAEIKRIHRST